MCNVLNCTIFSINRISFAEIHFCWFGRCVQQNLNQYHFLFKKKSQYLEIFKGVVTNINIFTKTFIFWENILRQIIIKNCLKGATSILFKIFWNQILSKYRHAPNERSKLRHYLKFPHGILLLLITSNPI